MMQVWRLISYHWQKQCNTVEGIGKKKAFTDEKGISPKEEVKYILATDPTQ